MLSNKIVLPNLLKSIIFVTAAMLSFNVSASDSHSQDLTVDESTSPDDISNTLSSESDALTEAELAAEKAKMEKDAEMAKEAELLTQ